jgi:hypothetical protein
LQVERQSHQPPARSTVQVLEDAAGQIEIRYRDRRMRWTEIAAPRPPTPAPPAAVPAPTPPRPRHRRPGADHPWHPDVDEFRTRLQVAAAKRAWMAVQP